MTFFYFAALLACDASKNEPRWRWLSLLFFFAAVMTKESALLFPFAVLVWDWALGTPWRDVWKKSRLYWIASALAALLLASIPSYRALLAGTLAIGNFHDNALTQLNAASVLLAHWLWPVAQNIDPDWPRVTDIGDVALPVMAWCALGVIAWRCRVQRPWVSFGIAWAVLHLLPMNAVLPRTDVANERLLYGADWGMFMALAVELQRLRRFALPILFVLAILLGSATVARNDVYRSEVALWQDTARYAPNKARVWNNYGYALQLENRQEEALAAYRRALKLDPNHVKAMNNIDRLTNEMANGGAEARP